MWIDTPLVRRCEGYFKRPDALAPSTFGRNLCGDPRLWSDLRAGRLGEERRARIRAWLDEQECGDRSIADFDPAHVRAKRVPK